MPVESNPKNRAKQAGKDLYRQLRELSCEQLWTIEVPRFDRAAPQERIERVSVIRAVGTVFSGSGTAAQRDTARPWLRRLLQDPSEKVRRYATAALPLLGAGAGEEAEMLSLLRTSTTGREKKALGEALGKIGGAATLAEIQAGDDGLLRPTEQRVKARLARDIDPGAIDMKAVVTEIDGLRIHLRGRRGLEAVVAEEVAGRIRERRQFELVAVTGGLVVLAPVAPFSLADLYELRCFDTVGLVLGPVRAGDAPGSAETLAAVIASPRSLRLLRQLTGGPIRYRLDFVGSGHRRAGVRLVADLAYALCPEILNDPSRAPWTIAVHDSKEGATAELVPHLTPDPRLYYRVGDVPAASHPPLAACMARMAGPLRDAVIWDPFCGSGLELVERALLGGVRQVHGTDLSPGALAIARCNFDAAKLPGVQAEFTQTDFRDFARIPGLGPETVDLVITNPPMGRRIRIPDLHGLIADMMAIAATVLKPGGQLIFPNPVTINVPPRGLRRVSGQRVDLGGFDCLLEHHQKRA